MATLWTTDFKLSMVKDIFSEKMKHVTAEDWRKNIEHVMDLEAKFTLDTSGVTTSNPLSSNKPNPLHLPQQILDYMTRFITPPWPQELLVELFISGLTDNYALKHAVCFFI